MRTFRCNGCLSCHVHPVPFMRLCHACPLPCTPPAMHTPTPGGQNGMLLKTLPFHNYRPQRSWAKVISLQASVCPHRGGVWPKILGGVSAPNFRGRGGVWPKFWGGGCLIQIWGGEVWSKFSGGSEIFFFFFFQFIFPQKISSGMHTPHPWDGQCAAGAHPAGMHSCYCCGQ